MACTLCAIPLQWFSATKSMLKYVQGLLPVLLAAAAIVSGLLFVKYYNAYEAPGEHWVPASPVTHETARFSIDLGGAGLYHIRIEKRASKFPLLFVEYQPPGIIMDTEVYSDDGMIRLNQRFADEGTYRITVQHTIHPAHREVIDFTVQTPLVKYVTDVFFFVLLLLAGYLSGKNLRRLMVVCLCVGAVGLATPHTASAHGMPQGHAPMHMVQDVDGVSLQWLHGTPPRGAANRKPMDWSVQLLSTSTTLQHIPFDLDIVHGETGFPVFHLEGVAEHGVIPLQYSAPDGTDYQLRVRAIVDGKVYHLSQSASADAIRPTASRQWKSFILLMIPALLGIFWGWRRQATAR